MEDKKKRQIPAFGQWDYYDDLPITQYFESAWQAGLVSSHFWAEDDELFKVPSPVMKPSNRHPHRHHHHHQKVKQAGGGGGENKQQEKERKTKKGRACDATAQRSPRKPARAPKAVDEDLYKIPPELLNQKTKRKRSLKNLVSGCLGLNCIA